MLRSSAIRMSPHSFRMRVFQIAAVFLLLFTATDLAYADMWCREENSPAASAVQFVAYSNSAPAQQGQDSDCFCCCGHVDVTASFEFVVTTLDSRLRHPQASYVPVAPPHLMVPPPRAA